MLPFACFARCFDTGVSGILDAGGVGRVGANAAACRVVVDFGVGAARSSTGGTAVCQVMDPGSSGVVLNSLVEGATVSSNHTETGLVPTPLHYHPSPYYTSGGELDNCKLSII